MIMKLKKKLVVLLMLILVLDVFSVTKIDVLAEEIEGESTLEESTVEESAEEIVVEENTLEELATEDEISEEGLYNDSNFEFVAPFSSTPIQGLTMYNTWEDMENNTAAINVLTNTADIKLSNLNTVAFQELFSADYNFETNKAQGGYAAFKGNVIKTIVKKGEGIHLDFATTSMPLARQIKLGDSEDYGFLGDEYDYYNDSNADVTVTIYLVGFHNDYSYTGYENYYYDSNATLKIRNLTAEEIEWITMPFEEKIKNRVLVVSWNDEIRTYLEALYDIHPELKKDVIFENLGVSGTDDEYLDALSNIINNYSDCTIIFALDHDVIRRLQVDNASFAKLNPNSLADIGFNVNNYKNSSYDYIYNNGLKNNKLYFATNVVYPGAVIYRKDIARKVLGTDDPAEVQKYIKDWDSFMETAKKTKAAGYSIVSGYEDIKYAYCDRKYNDFSVDPYVEKYVNGLITLDQLKDNYKKDKKTDLDNETLSYAYYAKKINPYTNGNEPYSTNWANDMNGNVLFWFGCTWFDQWIFNGTYDMGICQGTSPYVWGGTYYAAVYKGASKEKAAAVLNYLCNDATVMNHISQDCGYFVNNKTVNTDLINNNTEVFAFDKYDGQNPMPVWHANLLKLSNQASLADGTFANTTSKTENYAGATLSNSVNELKSNVLTKEEQVMVDAGEDIQVWLDVDDKTTTVSKNDKDKVESAKPQGFNVGSFLEINLYKKIGNDKEKKVTDVPKGKVKITLSVPSNLRKTGRQFKVLGVHNGTAKVYNVTMNGYDMTFETSGFSTYAIIYSDQANVKKVDMYRLYNPNSGEHFYTANAGERDHLVSVGWNYEGLGWTAPEKSNTPVYRLYNPNAGDHHYTMNKGERDFLVSIGWNDEGIGWYSDDAKGVPLYRQYNPNAETGSHNYTINKSENDWLVSLGWNEEGIGWYGVK